MTPLEGMQRAQDSFNSAADRIVRATLPDASGQPPDVVDLSTETVNLLQSRNAFEANVTAEHVSDQMAKTLVDLLA